MSIRFRSGWHWLGAAVAGLIVMLVAVDRSFTLARTWEYSAVRLERSFALALGVSIYPDLAKDAVLNAIYGPISAVLYWPATLASTPAFAVLIGHGLSALFFFGPVVLLLFGRSGPGGFASYLGLVVFGAVVINSVPLSYAAFTIHADAPALGLGLLACVLLSRADPSDRWPERFAIAAVAVLAVWSKQIIAPLLVALPLYVAWRDGRRAGARLLVALGAGMAAMAVVAHLTLAPISRLYFYLVALPASHGLDRGLGPWFSGLKSMALETATTWAVLIGAVISLLAGGKHGSAPEPPSSNRRRQPWRLFFLVAVVQVPLALVGRVKIGGDANSSAYVAYFGLAGAVLMLSHFLAEEPGPRRRRAGLSVAFLLAFLLSTRLVSAWIVGPRETPPPPIAEWPINRAYRAALARPGELYFPRLGIVHAMAEGEMYHGVIGFMDLDAAGIELPVAIENHFPPHLSRIAMQANGYHVDLEYMPIDDLVVAEPDPALPDFVIFRRGGEPDQRRGDHGSREGGGAVDGSTEAGSS